jgi:5'-nucleotidase
MPYSLDDKLVIGIASRALFDLDDANEVFERDGVEAYRKYQIERENETLKPGTAFPLVRALLNLNEVSPERLVEVVLISRNDADSGLNSELRAKSWSRYYEGSICRWRRSL